MSGRRSRTEHPGHCKLTAERICRDAENIAERLAKGKTMVKALSVEYDCNQVTLRKHLTAVIGKVRWRQLIYHRGPQPGTVHVGQPRRFKEEQIAEDTGPHCYHCTGPIEHATLKCPNCGAMQHG